MSGFTERDAAKQIDWRLSKIQECQSIIKQMQKKSKKAIQSGNPEVEQMCQRVIQSKQNFIEKLKKEIQQMDPRAVLRIKLAQIYMDQLDKTKEKRFLHKIENMDLSPSTLTRLLVQRLEGQYANQKLCLLTMNAIADRAGGKLWGDTSRKEKPLLTISIESGLLDGLQKPMEALFGKAGVELVKECLPKEDVVKAGIKSFVENPTECVTRACRCIEGTLGTKIRE